MSRINLKLLKLLALCTPLSMDFQSSKFINNYGGLTYFSTTFRETHVSLKFSLEMAEEMKPRYGEITKIYKKKVSAGFVSEESVRSVLTSSEHLTAPLERSDKESL